MRETRTITAAVVSLVIDPYLSRIPVGTILSFSASVRFRSRIPKENLRTRALAELWINPRPHESFTLTLLSISKRCCFMVQFIILGNFVIVQGWQAVVCPKCGSQMLEDRHFQALGSEVELVSKDAFLGDKLKICYCEKCGYIELYRGKKRGFWPHDGILSGLRSHCDWFG